MLLKSTAITYFYNKHTFVGADIFCNSLHNARDEKHENNNGSPWHERSVQGAGGETRGEETAGETQA